MRGTILNALEACKTEKNVRILLAVESGSRCWGFASKNSDYDVRFVYARPKNDYLRLESVRDTIEWRLDEELDIVGWDISKFLRLLRGSNPTAFEWLGSTITYSEKKGFEKVRELAPRCFNPVSHAHHYLGMASRHDIRYLRSGNATLKRYLYAVRALLACKWSIEMQRPVPMAFQELSDAMLDRELAPIVSDLVKTKQRGLESDRQSAIPELDAWISDMETHLKAQITSIKAPDRVPWDEIDAVFLDMIS